jgi:hypothetical protein
MNKRPGLHNASKVSIDKIIQNIRYVRDEQLQHLLDVQNMSPFLEEEFNVRTLSAVKLEFLKRDLLELKKSSLNLTHYATLINELKESNLDLPQKDHPLFLQELKLIFDKYLTPA